MENIIDTYKPLKQEPLILEFWKKTRIHEKANQKNKAKKKYYFLDGPPYTSGKVHIGTAWNKSLKDAVLRYKRMSGFDVWDRAGYDMHGLPIEHQVTAKYKLDTKEDIEKFGVAKFIDECKKFAIDSMHIMNQDFIRLGTWMDYDNAYVPITKQSIEAIWWLIKKVHEQNRLYEGFRTITWCASCETALAKHELEYKNIKDNSIFLKFKVKERGNEYLIIWTTTPWTIPMNLGVMVNPELDYVKAKVDNEYWYIAKALISVFVQGLLNKKFEIIEEFKGDKLEGIEYEPILYEELKDVYDKIKKKSKKTHTIILSSEYVDTSAGTGLVHMAPGCGPEDYEVGHKNGIPPFNNLDEKGVFPKEMNQFAGYVAKKDDQKLVEHFRKKGKLIEETEIEHDYAHCWRCHKPVIYRATKQWFFKVEDLKEKMIKENEKILWIPKAGFNAFDSWLRNLRDNSITKQRFWGTPLPVWKCKKCKDFDVLASIKEIKKASGKEPKRLHKPWIDEIKYKCKCGGVKERIPDIMDVWIDPGCSSWICLDYPKRKDLFEKLYPADFILEGKDQYRGWFNVLMVCSILAFKKPSFRACYVHGFVQDAKGRKMSKSLGNYILPQEVVNQYGADTLRYYMISGANPGIDINYNFEDMKVKHKNLIIFWNIHKFLIEMSKLIKKNPDKLHIDKEHLSTEEKYILSKLNSTIKNVTELYDNYLINEVPDEIEELLLNLSRVYIQLIRDKASSGKENEKEIVLWTIFKVYLEGLILFSPIVPFFTEIVYQNLKNEFNLKLDSIHHSEWPMVVSEYIDEDLEGDMEVSQNLVQSILSGREKIQMGVRWPLKEAIVVTHEEEAKKSIERFKEIIKKHTNVKNIKFQDKLKGLKLEFDKSAIGKDFGSLTPKIISKLKKEKDLANNIEINGNFIVKINNNDYKIEKRHIILKKDLPKDFEESQFWYGSVYLNKRLDKELEAEGFSREFVRRIQQMRKKAGLKKENEIKLSVICDKELIKRLEKFIKQIKVRVGASELNFVDKLENISHLDRFKIKGMEFSVGFDKLK